jgi:branched-chain amino acid transport system permease protein
MLGLLISDAFLITVGINIILTLSLFIPFYAGQWSLGISAFMSLGAYTSSLLTVKYHFPFIPALLLSALFVGLLGVILAFPALRIKGIFLAIATLGLGEIVVAVFESWDYVGGLSGLSGMRGTNVTNTYIIVGICILLSWKLANSRLGLLCSALRQDEVAADSLGVHCTLIKVLAFSFGASMTAVAGALSAHYMYYIEPSVFDFNTTMLVVIFLVFGGLETPWGAILGAFLLTLIPESIRGLLQWRMVVYGVVLCLMMVIRPNGLITKNSLLWIKRALGFERPHDLAR